MLTLAAKGTPPIAESEMTPGCWGSFSVPLVSEQEQSHQGEYEITAQVHMTYQAMSTSAAATKGTSSAVGSEITPERVGSSTVISLSEPELSHQGEYEKTARVRTDPTNPNALSTCRQAGGDNDSPRSSR
ncbi:hypothetical protein E2C01_023651 [Portunus trituberculatus]|uniref:Uncharacterized protein n=1 Tax=Portunus trituberculatus TaxID=210409 RepID=A0A5B7E9N4_PORTR|nr:hypothetical protein [Portunus trituberculatus]